MRNKRALWIGAYVVAAAVLIAGIAIVIRDRADGDGAKQSAASLPDLAPMPFPTALTLNSPTQGSIGSQFSLAVEGYSEEPIASVSLFDGATRISTQKPVGESSAAQVTFPALSVGPHALHAEVTDAEGRVSLSPVVPVSVHVATSPAAVVPYAPPADGSGDPAQPADPDAPADPVGTPAPTPSEDDTVAVPVPSDEGETSEGVAERLHLEPGQISVTDVVGGKVVPLPDLAPTDPIPKGATVVANVEPDAGLKATIGDIATVTNPDATAGTKLKLTGQADGCGVALTAKGADGPVYFFDANGGVPGWASVGETDGDGTLTLPAPAPGAHTYFARTDSTKSLTVSVAVPLKCGGDAGWTGDAKIIEGVLYLPPAAVGPVSLYLALDGGTSVRIPEKGAFSAGYETDISDQLPALSGRSVQLQVWRATEFNADQVAGGSLTVPEGTSLSQVIGEPGILTLTSSAPDGATTGMSATKQTFRLEHDDATFTFDWESQSSRVDEVLYRVYTSPEAPESLTGPTIVASGISQRSGDGATSTGSFTIDTADIPGHEAVAERNEELANPPAGEAPPSSDSAGLDIIEGLKAYTPPATPQTIGKLDGFKASTPTTVGAQIDPALLQTAANLPGPGEAIYVDVVANPNGPAVGSTSNNIGITLPTPEPAEDASSGVTLTADELVLDPGRAPNPTMGNCAEVVLPPQSAVDAYKEAHGGAPAFGPTAFYREGSGTYCLTPGTPEGCILEDIPVVGSYACEVAEFVEDGIDAIVEVVKQLYDLAAYMYNGAISGIVSAIAKYNPICVWLNEADESVGKGCVTVVSVVVRTVITVVLAYFGLPPALPTRQELDAVARGELDVAAVGLMEYLGVPCDDVKADPELAAAMELAAGEMGAEEEAEALKDPCLWLAKFVLDQVEGQVKAAMSAKTATATGLPNFPDVPGFELKPDQRTLPSPMTVTYSAHAAKFDAQIEGLVCRVTMLPSAPSRGKQYPYPFWFPGPGAGKEASFPLTREDPLHPGVFSGSGVIADYSTAWGDLAVVLDGLDEQMSVRAAGQCTGGEATTHAVVRPYEE